MLRQIVIASWYVLNDIISRDRGIRSASKMVTNLCGNYKARFSVHPNNLASDLLNARIVRRFKKFKPLDLANRFAKIYLYFYPNAIQLV